DLSAGEGTGADLRNRTFRSKDTAQVRQLVGDELEGGGQVFTGRVPEVLFRLAGRIPAKTRFRCACLERVDLRFFRRIVGVEIERHGHDDNACRLGLRAKSVELLV